MRLLFALSMLMLTGCGSGYHVSSIVIYPCGNVTGTSGVLTAAQLSEGKCAPRLMWRCQYTRPIFWNDLTKAYCESEYECTKTCAIYEARK